MHGWWSCQLSHHCMPQRRTAGPDGRSYHEPNLERPKVLKYWPAFHCPLFSLVSRVAMKNRARCEVDVEGMNVLLVKHQAQRTRNGGYLSTKHLCFGYLIFDLCQLDLCRSLPQICELPSWAYGSGSRVWPSGGQQNISKPSNKLPQSNMEKLSELEETMLNTLRTIPIDLLVLSRELSGMIHKNY